MSKCRPPVSSQTLSFIKSASPMKWLNDWCIWWISGIRIIPRARDLDRFCPGMVKFNFPSGALDTILLWRYYSCQQSPPAKEVFVIQELYMKLLTIAFYRRYRLQLAVFGLFI